MAPEEGENITGVSEECLEEEMVKYMQLLS